MEEPQSADVRPRPWSEVRPFRGDRVKTSPRGRVPRKRRRDARAHAGGARAPRGGHSERTGRPPAPEDSGLRPPAPPAPGRRGKTFLVLRGPAQAFVIAGAPRVCASVPHGSALRVCARVRGPPSCKDTVTLAQGHPAPPGASRRVEVPSP